ncbi:hypothetical protein, partial [Fictibacillus barbaricus]
MKNDWENCLKGDFSGHFLFMAARSARLILAGRGNRKIRAEIEKYERKSKNTSGNRKIRAEIEKYERKSK